MAEPLVSIIIPTYNRAHLIGETLDSILAQTYQNWECIVVDDGSIDNSEEIILNYNSNDSRIHFFRRPQKSIKGAPTCRNIGLEKACGEYIIFFDSDDLMTSDHIQKKITPLLSLDYDFSITKTKYYNEVDESIERYYNFEQFELTPYNYILQNLNFLTLDVCIESSIAKSIRFNEVLKSGQEFNYFSKLIVKTQKFIFINEYVSLRRKHDDSIRGKLVNSNKIPMGHFISMWETYKELKVSLTEKTRRELLFKCIKIIYAQKQFFAKDKIQFFRELYFNFGGTALYFIPMIIVRKFSFEGYHFRNKLKEIAYN